MFSSVETSAGQTFPHSPMDIDYWEKLGNCVWEYLAHMEWRGVFRHTVCRGVLGSYGVYWSIPIIRYAGEYLAHIQCRGVFQSYGMQGSTCKISTIGHSWAQRKLSPLNILLTINGPLLS